MRLTPFCVMLWKTVAIAISTVQYPFFFVRPTRTLSAFRALHGRASSYSAKQTPNFPSSTLFSPYSYSYYGMQINVSILLRNSTLIHEPIKMDMSGKSHSTEKAKANRLGKHGRSETSLLPKSVWTYRSDQLMNPGADLSRVCHFSVVIVGSERSLKLVLCCAGRALSSNLP